MTTETMEYMREQAAAGYYDPRDLKAQARLALLMAIGTFPINSEKAWEYTQFAADMLRHSLNPREVA